MNPYERYRELERKLIHVRWLHRGLDSSEEEALLEEMDAAWWKMSEEQRARIDAEPPRSLIRSEPLPVGSKALQDVDVFAAPSMSPRLLGEVA